MRIERKFIIQFHITNWGKKNIERVKGGANRSSDLGHVPVPTNNKRSDIIRHNIIQQLVYPFFFIYPSISQDRSPLWNQSALLYRGPFFYSAYTHIYITAWWCWLAFRTLSCTSLSIAFIISPFELVCVHRTIADSPFSLAVLYIQRVGWLKGNHQSVNNPRAAAAVAGKAGSNRAMFFSSFFFDFRGIFSLIVSLLLQLPLMLPRPISIKKTEWH